MARPTRIDPLLLGGHALLSKDDECYAFGEYTSGAGYAYGATNDFISNLKKGREKEGTPEWHYKLQAIERAARLLQGLPAAWLERVTLVPLPPSTAVGEPAYDDRIFQILNRLAVLTKLALDIRKLLYQTKSTRSSSRSPGQRLTVGEIREVYRLNETLAEPPPKRIVLVDDLLTTGAHFRVAKEILQREWPGLPVLGMFLARTVR